MVRIRLRRVGMKGQPSYRIVVTDKRSPRDGRFIEKIGFYNPRTEPATMEINEERALYWLSTGAQPSEAVDRILGKLGTKDRLERLKAGEELAALLEEAAAALTSREAVDPRTRRDDLPKKSKKKAAEATLEETAEAEVEEAEEEETETEVEEATEEEVTETEEEPVVAEAEEETEVEAD